MLTNRSMPRAVVIPELAYPDVGEAVKWLCHVFGFRQRLIIANHRVQLLVGKDGAVVVVQSSAGDGQDSRHSIMVRVPEVREHYATSKHRGATILKPLADYPYGERQYTAQDLGGHIWTFSQSISDVDPAQWGGEPLRVLPRFRGEGPRGRVQRLRHQQGHHPLSSGQAPAARIGAPDCEEMRLTANDRNS
jgi:uncharacterized glyoxalase superfamily protein PhnB